MSLAHMWLDGWGVLIWLATAAFWILVIAGIVALVRGHGGGDGGGGVGGSALRLLEQRYARGEISREEFFERRSTLVTPPGAPPSPPPEDRTGEQPAPPADRPDPGDEETKPLDPRP
jgi:putative membrane protein